MPKARFILCEDGSYLQIRNIIRLSVAEDAITRRGDIKASMIGPAMPFKVAGYDTQLNARQALSELIDYIEGKVELWNSSS